MVQRLDRIIMVALFSQRDARPKIKDLPPTGDGPTRSRSSHHDLSLVAVDPAI